MREFWWFIPLTYLLGSIPFGFLLTLIFTREDIRKTGSGNIGATNVSRKLGMAGGIATLILDAGKGVLAVFLASHYTGHPVVTGASAFAVVLGHCYPVFLKFRGGKGVATAAGVFYTLSPLSAIAATGVLVAAVAGKGYVSLGSCLAAASMPIIYLLIEKPHQAMVIFTVLIACMIILRHGENIQRIVDGTESKFPHGRS